MAGLEKLDEALVKNCNDIIETATKIKNLEIRDPEQARNDGVAGSRKFGDLADTVRIIAGENAFGELEALRKSKQQDGQGGC